MSEILTVTSLDSSDPVSAMLSFGSKTAIAIHGKKWVYRLGGVIMRMPDPTIIYASYSSKNNWAVSRNLAEVLKWIEDQAALEAALAAKTQETETI